MAEFKVGGRVICIESVAGKSSMGEEFCYKKDLIYVVNDIVVCGCGTKHLWLGDILKLGTIKNSRCPKCKTGFGEKVLTLASHFLPLDDFKEVTFTEIKKEVPVSAQ